MGNDENWPRVHRPQQKQQLRSGEEVLQRLDTNETGQFDFSNGAGDKSMWTTSLSQNAPSWLQGSQPCSVVVPAYSSKQRLRDFSYEPPRSRAPLRYYYPVARSRSSTPRREYSSPTPRYMNALKTTYGTMPHAQPSMPAPAQPASGVFNQAVPVPTYKSLAPGTGTVQCGSQQTLAQYISKVPTPCKYRNPAASAMPTTLAPSGSSYLTSKDSAPTSLCSTVNRTNQATRLQPQPVPTVPGQSAHSLLGPASRQPTDLVQTIQLTQADLQERMVKQKDQQVVEKEQELQLTKVSLEEKDRELAKRDKELLEKEGEINELRRTNEEQASRKDEDLAERDKTILHLQAKVECLEQEAVVKDEWCRKRDEAARRLEGTLRSERSSFEAQKAKREQELEQKTQEARDCEADLRKKEREMEALRDQVRKLEDQVLNERRASEEMQYKSQGLIQELHRQIQELSTELTKCNHELEAMSRGNTPSFVKESRQARQEDPENISLKEKLAVSEANVQLLQQCPVLKEWREQHR